MNIYILTANFPKMLPFCAICHTEIKGIPCFCKKLGKLYHKNCLKKENLHCLKVKQTPEKPEHKDYPVLIKFKES